MVAIYKVYWCQHFTSSSKLSKSYLPLYPFIVPHFNANILIHISPYILNHIRFKLAFKLLLEPSNII